MFGWSLQIRAAVSILSIFILFLLLSASCAKVSGDMDAAITETGDYGNSTVGGDVHISVIYLVDEIERGLVETVEPILGAYDIISKKIVESMATRYYFPSQLCYPYQFSDGGIISLRERLQNLDIVVPSSVKVDSLPNIPYNELYMFEGDDVIVNETYVRFTIKGWDNIDFMYFPMFLVIRFNYTQSGIESNDDYKQMTSSFAAKMEEFKELSNLREALNIDRQNQKFTSKPILAFIYLEAYYSEAFQNTYIWGSEDWSVKQDRFTRDVSLPESGQDESERDYAVHHYLSVSHEYSNLWVWRFYYSPAALFYNATQYGIWIAAEDHPIRQLSQVVRSALFANIIIGDALNQLYTLDTEVVSAISVLANKRDNITNLSYQDLDQIENLLAEYNRLKESAMIQVKRIWEIQEGANRLIYYADDPNESLSESHQRFLHFDVTRYSDMERIRIYNKDLTEVLNTLDDNINRFNTEITVVTELAEARRDILENKKNVALSILLPAFGTVVFIVGYLYCRRYQGYYIPLRYFHRIIVQHESSPAFSVIITALGAAVFGILYLLYIYLYP